MKLIAVVLVSLFIFQDPIPFKPTDEFELKLDLQFKPRPKADVNTIELDHRTLPTSGMKAPYLYINLRVLKPVAEEVRVKVLTGTADVLLARKFDPKLVIKLDLGFTDDIKDRASPHQFVITFISKNKDPLSRIEIFFEEDGTYLVNGEKRGKI